MPIKFDAEKDKVLRTTHDLTNVYDPYSKKTVDQKKLIEQIFYNHGRVRHHERILCWFPSFLEKNLETTASLLWSNETSCLDLHVKLYLGIMAVSCFNCTYLLNILEAQFVVNCKEKSDWVTVGLKAVDQRV